MRIIRTFSSTVKEITCLTLVLLFFYTFFLGSRILSVPDEARYSEIPREMIVTQDYLIPRINGVKYFEKPPLFYWIQVASIKLIGLNNWGLRFANMLLGVIGVLSTHLFVLTFYNRKIAWFASLMLASMPLYFVMSHSITLDMSVATWISISLFACYTATQTTTAIKRRLLMYLAFSAAACAVLTKGLIGIVFPAAIMGIWMLCFQQWRLLKILYLPSSILLFLVITLPWHILVQCKAPEFFDFYVIHQQLLRYTTMEAHRYQPFWFFIPVVLLGSLPWIVAFPRRIDFFKHKLSAFLLIWFAFIIVFFSASHSKLIPYMVPALPPLAVLLATQWQSVKKFIIVLFMTASVLLIALTHAERFDTRPIKPLTDILLTRITPQDEVIAYHHYYQDLPLYLQRIITVNEGFNELTFGMQHENTSAWMIHDEAFFKRWYSDKTVYLVIDQEKYRSHPELAGTILARTKTDLLVINKQE